MLLQWGIDDIYNLNFRNHTEMMNVDYQRTS